MNPPKHSPLAAPELTVQLQMRRVLLALSPGIVLYTAFFGWGLIVQILLASFTALVCEAFMLKIRQRPVAQHLGDYSALVTAWLLAICLPPLLPWWMTVLAVATAIILAKHLYGGLGYNLFNPAMVGYALLLVSFPREMTQWQPNVLTGYELPGFVHTVAIIFGSDVIPHLDGLSTATPLDHYKHSTEAAPLLNGIIAGRFWEWIALAWLAGGIWLGIKGVLDWRIPAALLATTALFSVGLALGSDHPAWQNPLFHLLSGGTILAAFFIATDPVTASTTPMGRWIYGAGIGLLAMVIRLWGGYPDGFAFAVLLMNLAAPLIDHLTVPRAYGQR